MSTDIAVNIFDDLFSLWNTPLAIPVDAVFIPFVHGTRFLYTDDNMVVDFFDQELISCCYSSCSCWATSSKQA